MICLGCEEETIDTGDVAGVTLVMCLGEHHGWHERKLHFNWCSALEAIFDEDTLWCQEVEMVDTAIMHLLYLCQQLVRDVT